MAMFSRLGPMMASATIMMSIMGIDWRISASILVTVSKIPPKYPATRPKTTPRVVVPIRARPQMDSETLPPANTRLNTSRPSESVPMIWAREGARFLDLSSPTSGS